MGKGIPCYHDLLRDKGGREVTVICGETRGEVARRCLGWVSSDRKERWSGSDYCKGRRRNREGWGRVR
jgi:hypothetical protein